MLNRIILIGRLTRDPELRYTSNGIAVARFALAVNRNYSNQQGERAVDFIDVVTWRGLAETCANYLKKGRLVGVEGRLQISSYENNEGRKVRNAEVVADNVQFLESMRDRNDSNQSFGSGSFEGGNNNFNSNNFGSSNRPSDDPFASDGKPIDISDDDLPF
ncbi:single-stranded DNA-binding protein [Hazenella sp. IB182357]|uniref:Single-stranded DNA-binding protein n=1 Tax=Polycladospora coralii TaxID=2771432 RepID=A0A926N8Y2_9BACL|nr:single-stranded DNA-binding protein [Polycladospora coralii]MBD1371992.1 single-stranded DNA-binding protein [Polycladospora coralii]MBS7530498.1 single-stranded DNA-binding protein [Polycladospora coralii]